MIPLLCVINTSAARDHNTLRIISSSARKNAMELYRFRYAFP